MAKQQMNEEVCQCPWYNTFGDCADGCGKCEKRHEGEIAESTYFYARIEKLESRGLKNGHVMVFSTVSGKRKERYVANWKWHTAGADVGDNVLFQSSRNEYKRYGIKNGRVIAKVTSSPTIRGQLSTPVQVEVSTIDPEGTENHDDAYSIERCQGGCKLIGVHISATALEQGSRISGADIPCFPNEFFKRKLFTLDKDKVALAISIYMHTKCEAKVYGPVFTQVRVANNYSHSNFKKYKNDLTDLWKQFGDSSVLNVTKHNYIARYPQSWRQMYVISEMMRKYQSVAKQSLLSETKQCSSPHSFIIRILKPSANSEEIGSSDPENVVISKELRENYLTVGTENSRHRVLAFAAACTEVLRPHASQSSSVVPKREYEIGPQTTLTENYLPCTSPLRKLLDYVNQQILINRLLRNSKELYSHDDLLGILVDRFRTPCISSAIVTVMEDKSFRVQYPDLLGISSTISRLPFTLFGDNTNPMNGLLQIKLKNLSCATEQFCNENMVTMNKKELQTFVDQLREWDVKMLGGRATQESLPKTPIVQTDKKSPYQNVEDGIQLVLQAGIKLRIQISNRDARDKNDLGLRLLKIGNGCHVCFTHIQNPALAFVSQRRDVRDLVKQEDIENLKQATTDQKLAGSSLLPGLASIKWDGEYHSGGSLFTSGKLTKGDLLCIRKELTTKRSGEYVWCCHGVVSNVTEEKVAFKVCTLMQSKPDPNGESFIVEIVRC